MFSKTCSSERKKAFWIAGMLLAFCCAWFGSASAVEIDLDAWEIVQEWDLSEASSIFAEEVETVAVIVDGEERHAARRTYKGLRNTLTIFLSEPIAVTDLMAVVLEYRVETTDVVRYTMLYVDTSDGRIGQEQDGGTPIGEWVQAVYFVEELRAAPHAQTAGMIELGNEITRIQVMARGDTDDTESTLTLARVMLVQP